MRFFRFAACCSAATAHQAARTHDMRMKCLESLRKWPDRDPLRRCRREKLNKWKSVAAQPVDKDSSTSFIVSVSKHQGSRAWRRDRALATQRNRQISTL
jgi:hypothetical protein